MPLLPTLSPLSDERHHATPPSYVFNSQHLRTTEVGATSMPLVGGEKVRKESSRVCNFFSGLVGMFVKLRKATITFVMPSVRSQGTAQLSLNGFSYRFILEDVILISIYEIQVQVKYFTYAHLQYERISTFTRLKQCLYRPGQTLRVPGRRGYQISRQPAY